MRVLARTLLALGLCASAVGHAEVRELHFDNLGEPAHVVAEGGRYHLYHRGSRIPVRLVDRLLASAPLELTSAQLRAMHADILEVQQLAPGSDARIWLLTVAEGQLAPVLESLQAQPDLRGVQPDLLQLRTPSGLPGAPRSAVAGTGPLQSPQDRDELLPRVAIIDDGFDFSDPALAGAQVLFEYDADRHLADASPASAVDRHGTRVAAVVLAAGREPGGASRTGLIAIRQASTWSSDLVLAFSVARMMRADIVNASWVLAYLPQPLAELLGDWQRSDVPPYLVVAAGNDGRDACRANALSQVQGAWLVGALDAQGAPARYSNHGDCVSLSAPVQHAFSRAGERRADLGGTSAAAAHVSGLLARALARDQRPSLEQLQQQLAPAGHRH